MSAERSFVVDGTVSNSLETTQRVSVSDYFADLPVAPNTNLEILASLLPQSENADIRRKIIDRYLDIYNLRKGVGIYGNPEINLEMAIALLDEATFTEAIQEVKSEGAIIRVATHEMGHVLVASAVGWDVSSVTVVPASSYLGLTVTSPKGEKSLSDWAVESAAISYGGALAAQMAGHEVRGHGSDFASARAKARIAMADPNCKFSSEEQFLSYAQNLAHSSLAGKESMIHRMAMGLTARKTIV